MEARPGLLSLLPKPVVFLVAENDSISASRWGKFRGSGRELGSEPAAFGAGNSSCNRISWRFNAGSRGKRGWLWSLAWVFWVKEVSALGQRLWSPLLMWPWAMELV